jgi:hypothetical protein
MNILIKLMSIVSLVIAPTLAQMKSNTTGENITKNKPANYQVETKSKQIIVANTVQYK